MAMEEDLMHALITCSHAQAFWNEAQTWFSFRLGYTMIHGLVIY